jgi:hypothetical protein
VTKREFLGILGGGAGLLLTLPTRASAQRPRLLRGEAEDDVLAGGGQSPAFRQFLETVRVGDARAHGALLAFWLHGRTSAPPFEIATLEEARARGDLLITERDHPTVSSLIVDNRGPTHVLLLAGEILLGGKQHRVVKEDLLLPPASGARSIQVYCVEQGRWAGTSTTFSPKGAFAAPALRAKVLNRADQAKVWAEVDRYSRRALAFSPTASYQSIHDKPEVAGHQRQVEQTIDHRTAPGAIGAAVFVGETLAGLDLFRDASLFARQWPKLLRAHAIDTYGRRPQRDPDERRERARAEEFLRLAAASHGTIRRNAGAGHLFEFRADRFRGTALVAEDQVVHAVIL